jgi:hypothetical protein
MIFSVFFYQVILIKKMNRKKFVQQVVLGTTGLFVINQTLTGQIVQQKQIVPPDLQEPPPMSLDLVKEFVIAGHGDFAKVQSMLKEHPNLIYTKFDWGNGDDEAAIEGAGHVGNTEIANFLLSRGSRVTLHVLSMLGNTELVKPVLETYPNLVFAKGPHGFTMLHHAKLAGKQGEELYEYLQKKGLKEDWIKLR